MLLEVDQPRLLHSSRLVRGRKAVEMPVAVRWDGGAQRIEVVAFGEIFENEREVALECATEFLRERGPLGLLVDWRLATSAATAEQVRNLAQGLVQKPGPMALGIAVVVLEGMQFGLARMFQAHAELVGLPVAVFTDIASAEAWLTARGRRPVD